MEQYENVPNIERINNYVSVYQQQINSDWYSVIKITTEKIDDSILSGIVSGVRDFFSRNGEEIDKKVALNLIEVIDLSKYYIKAIKDIKRIAEINKYGTITLLSYQEKFKKKIDLLVTDPSIIKVNSLN